eukprot:gene5367-9175_t
MLSKNFKSMMKNSLKYYSKIHSTTVLAVRKNEQTVIIADGQVSFGNTILKGNARKLRNIGTDIVAGFAGSAADGLSLFEKLETKVQEYPGQLTRACVELAKMWRSDKFLRRLEAQIIGLVLTGSGDVVEPSNDVVAIGSGGNYATAAALALIDIDGFTAEDIALKSMKIASDICIYTNSNFTVLKL